MKNLVLASCSCAALVLGASAAVAAGPAAPWMNTALSPDQRAALLTHELTTDEQIGLLHGPMAMPFLGMTLPAGAIGSAGYIPGIARVGVPALQESDASLGVANPLGVRPGDYATALPSGLAQAASFNPSAAYQGGAMIGHEARAKGMNVLLAGGVNLTRDPRNGRNFEYLGEDPLLAGSIAGQAIAGIQSQGIVSTIKHFAVNGQETNRHWANSVIAEDAMRESDLLAFEIAIERGQPGSVMCAYNLVNGDYSCGNDHLLNDVLKKDWGYKGWVMSDWGAVHGVADALKGLDQESGQQLDGKVWFDTPLKSALQNKEIAPARVADMTQRILRSMFAAGLFDDKSGPGVIDDKADLTVARQIADEGVVLLKNSGGVLPLAKTASKIAVIGGYANLGVLSGGGSSQVVPKAPYRTIPMGGEGSMAQFRNMLLDPSAPLAAMRRAAHEAKIVWNDGRYISAAVAAAKDADIVVVFATQWSGEGEDQPDLTLPNGQDALIAAVAAANPKTVVVLETGGPVLMPWLDKAAAVVEAWYPGAQGGEAIADVLFGDVDASGRLPMTFPASIDQYPRAELPGLNLGEGVKFDVPYTEGADIGYRRFAANGAKPLFPFGFGLSYAHFTYSGLKVNAGKSVSVTFTVTNDSKRDGKDAPQVYVKSLAGQPALRLIAFDKLSLKAGESRTVTLPVDPRLLAHFDVKAHGWSLAAGDYEVAVGHAASDLSLSATARLGAQKLKP